MTKKMYSNRNKGIKNFFRKRFYYKRQLKRFICILIILSLILILKMINNKLTSNVIQIINKGINYEFSIKEDSKRVLNYSKKLLELSEKTLEALNIKNKPIYSPPIEGAIYNPFGEVKHLDGSISFNNGVDIIPKDEKEPIVIEKGVVSKIEDKNTKGYFVTIQHENMTTVYGYLIEVYLSKGEKVNPGDKIGSLGTNKDGNKYLHFEIWMDGVPVNPMEYVKFSKSI